METLDADNTKKTSFSNWELSTRTPSLETERMALNQNYDQLHIIQKREQQSDRPMIPATFFEKLAFYRSFISSPSKTQVTCTQQVKFNRFLWFYIINVFCKSLPNTYVYMFLSTYVPDQHLFLSKMVPIAYGSNFAFIAAGFINLASYTDTVVILLDYVIIGILYKSPWNRCPREAGQLNNRTTICYNIDEFSTMLQNKTLFFQHGVYKSYRNESFNIAPIVYYRQCVQKLKTMYLYFALLWIVAALQYRQLFKRYLWKTLHNTQMILNVMYVVSFGHIVITHFETELKIVATPHNELSNVFWEADLDILSESMTAPPIVHVLTSKSTTKVQPDHESSAMVISNALYYIFRGLLAYRLKKHCENHLKTPILLSEFNPNSFFYLWPIYFSSFHLGNLYALLYFVLSFTMEFSTIIISLQCLIETIVCEWKWAKRELVTVVVIVLGIFYKGTTDSRIRLLLYIYSIGAATTFEVLILYCLYPLGRLVDDITFFNGIPPTTFRVLNMRIVPIFYLMKMYVMLKGFFKILTNTNYINKIPYYRETLYLTSVPFILGAVYAGIRCLCVDKKSLKCLFKPIPEWGPKDRVTRQLRKQYDSRYYVGSQAPRKLSRYVIQKSSLESYKLDVMYDNYARHSSHVSTDIHTEDEKKRK